MSSLSSMEDKAWIISLLGTRKTGKTCYLGCFYHHYGNNSSANNVNTTDFFVYTSDPYRRGILEEFAERITSSPPQIFPTGLSE